MTDSKDKASHTFTTLISDKGLYYSVEVYFTIKGRKVNKVTFQDSLKLIPLSVDQIAKSFHLPISKLEIDYSRHNYLPEGSELSKEEIEYIMKNKPKDLEIETFIHGAICYAYSGRCHLSDFLASRSANLGDCAQSCRWSYNLYAEEKNNPGEFMPIEVNEHGTSIQFKPDAEIFKEGIKLDYTALRNQLKELSYLSPGLIFEFTLSKTGEKIKICENTYVNKDNIKVDVRNPEVIIHVEVRHDKSYIYFNGEKGLGGYPSGIAGKGLVMMSGGIDSPVATYLSIRKGVMVSAIHYASPPYTSDMALQKVIDLLEQLSIYQTTQNINSNK